MGDSIPLLQHRVHHNPHDSEAWQMLVDQMWNVRRAHGMLEKLKETAHVVVLRYPSAGKVWKVLVDLELERHNLDGAVEIFGKSLLQCYNVPLWTSYMEFIKKSNACKGDSGQAEVMKAYDYVLDRLGQDSAAGELWQEYINFLAAVPPSSSTFRMLFEPEVGKEASKRALRLRDLYQKALQVPCEQLEVLWADYERFETASAGRNLLAAQRFVDEARPRYQAAKDALPARNALLLAIDRDALPWQPQLGLSSQQFVSQLQAWREFLEYEKSNPQTLDPSLHRTRVDLAYQQALQPLAACPEMWYEWAVVWRRGAEEHSSAHECAVLKQACAALPDCVMLSFALADALEATGKHAEALKVFEGLLERMDKPLDSGGLSAETGNSVWVQYMRFHQRTAQTSQEAQNKCRRIFMQAIKWPRVSWHVYAGHALMEWYQNHGLKTQNLAHSIHIVKKVFDLGLEAPHVQCVPEYIRTYANWLVESTTVVDPHQISTPLHGAGTVGDVENARLVYKNAVANEEVYRLPEIWEYFLDFEAAYGTVQEMLTVEGQRRAALPDVAAQPIDSVHAMRTRYTLLDLWPCTTAQRQHIEGLQGRGKDHTTIMSGDGEFPAQMSIFMNKLPAELELDQPLPDLDLVIDILMHAPQLDTSGSGTSMRGLKRGADALDSANGGRVDIFTMRRKMRTVN